MQKEWLSPKEVAYKLQISYHTIIKLIKSGEMKAYKIGRHYKIKPTDIDVFLEKSKVNNNKQESKNG